MTQKEPFAERLRWILEEEDITVAMLAEWSGVSAYTINSWMKGTTPRPQNLLPIAKVLRRSVDFLLCAGCAYCKDKKVKDLKKNENFCKSCGRHLRGVFR